MNKIIRTKKIQHILLVLCAVIMLSVMIPMTVSADGELPNNNSLERLQRDQPEFDKDSDDDTTKAAGDTTTHENQPTTTIAVEQIDSKAETGEIPKTGDTFYITALWLMLCGATALVVGLSAKQKSN